jgi:site-specific DNA-methyltransferase (adenine-specific)
VGSNQRMNSELEIWNAIWDAPALVLEGDCLEVLKRVPDNSVDAVVTDPPYDLTSGGGKGFMGKAWDGTGIAFRVELWAEVLRVLKPGGHVLAFGGTRTSHRMACAIEDAGFEIRDSIHWNYATGFPKSLDVSKALDKAAGAEREVIATRIEHDITRPKGGGNERLMVSAGEREARVIEITAPATEAAQEWEGWGTALKPSHEPIVLARKPLSESSVAANVQKWGTGALNIGACRIDYRSAADQQGAKPGGKATAKSGALAGGTQHDGARSEFTADNTKGRWPANSLFSHSPECAEACAPGCPVAELDAQSGNRKSGKMGPQHTDRGKAAGRLGAFKGRVPAETYGDEGGASRFFQCFPGEVPAFFYVAKPTRKERDAGCETLPLQTRNRVNPGGLENDPKFAPVQAKNVHPTVKPVALMRYLCKLITPPGGVVLDMFAGSGSTGVGAVQEGFRFLGIEKEPDYRLIACARIEGAVKLSGETEG